VEAHISDRPERKEQSLALRESSKLWEHVPDPLHRFQFLEFSNTSELSRGFQESWCFMCSEQGLVGTNLSLYGAGKTFRRRIAPQV
jgi:hypothetical protein